MPARLLELVLHVVLEIPLHNILDSNGRAVCQNCYDHQPLS